MLHRPSKIMKEALKRKQNFNLVQIKDQLEYDKHHTFGEVIDKVKRYQPGLDEKYHKSTARRMAQDQFWHLINYHKDDCEQYRIIKLYLQQTIDGEFIKLAINNRGQANLQQSKALQRLLKEGLIKVVRDHGKDKIGYGLKGFRNWSNPYLRGWKPYTTAQTYVQWYSN